MKTKKILLFFLLTLLLLLCIFFILMRHGGKTDSGEEQSSMNYENVVPTTVLPEQPVSPDVTPMTAPELVTEEPLAPSYEQPSAPGATVPAVPIQDPETELPPAPAPTPTPEPSISGGNVLPEMPFD